MHDGSQEGLYLLLGDFLREHDLAYPQGSPVVRFSLSNEGRREIFLDAIRLVFRSRGHWSGSGEQLVLDPAGDRVLPLDLAEGVANVLGRERGGDLPVRLAPGDGVGYKFELVRLANTLRKEDHAGNVRLALEATGRLGNVHRRPSTSTRTSGLIPKHGGREVRHESDPLRYQRAVMPPSTIMHAPTQEAASSEAR